MSNSITFRTAPTTTRRAPGYTSSQNRAAPRHDNDIQKVEQCVRCRRPKSEKQTPGPSLIEYTYSTVQYIVSSNTRLSLFHFQHRELV
jgi:hypothetical protein